MFLELHLEGDNEKIMLNINRINSIYQIKGTTKVYTGRTVYQVKESYDDIAKAIDKHYNA